MKYRNRISANSKIGCGDYNRINTNNNKISPKAKAFVQGDILRNLLAKSLNLNIEEKEIIQEFIFVVHDILCKLQEDKYDLSHLKRGTIILNKEINKITKNVCDVPEFVSFVLEPGITLDKLRTEVRLFEVLLIEIINDQESLVIINRFSTYLFWIAWKYHQYDNGNIFRRKSNFDKFN